MDKKIYYIDIDETICHNTNIKDHNTASPLPENVAKVNKLYDEGHHIVFWTSRGETTKRDWSELTKQQLQEWGVKHHELKFGKPFFDVFIDDKAVNVKDWE